MVFWSQYHFNTNTNPVTKLRNSSKFQPLKCRFSIWNWSPKKPKIAAILNSTQQSGHVFVLPFRPRDFIQIRASGKPFLTITLGYGCSWAILVPRGRASFGQHQKSRSLGRSNTGSPRVTDYSSNLIGWEKETITLRMLRKLDQARGRYSRPLGTRMLLSSIILSQTCSKLW